MKSEAGSPPCNRLFQAPHDTAATVARALCECECAYSQAERVFVLEECGHRNRLPLFVKCSTHDDSGPPTDNKISGHRKGFYVER
jgi:hypothetical protein